MKNEFWETKDKDITNKALPDTGDQSEDPVIKEIQLCITYVDGNKIYFINVFHVTAGLTGQRGYAFIGLELPQDSV